MGLHHTAHYLKSKGRGNDTMLVHMTPGEVKGLQALALRHGGSLTINPDTGLPEAGFLEDILPVVAAAGLTYITAGAATPVLAGALGPTMGGIAAGALSGAAISGLTAAAMGKDAGRAALMGGIGGGVAGGLGAYADAPNLLAETTQKMATAPTPEIAAQIQQSAIENAAQSTIGAGGLPTPPPDVSNVYSGLAGQPTVAPGTIPTGLVDVPYAPTQAGIDAAKLTGQARIDALNALDPSARAFGQAPGIDAEQALYRAENLARPTAVGDIYKPITQESVKAQMPTTFYQDQGTIGRLAIQGLPAIGLLGDEALTQPSAPEDEYVSPIKRISPNFQAQAPVRPNPYYRAQYPIYGAEGGEVKTYQSGGPVERMTAMNTAINPQGGLYPQGMIDKTQYATPTQRPASMELLDTEPSYQKSNPLVTAAGMAQGGQVKGYAAGGMPDFGNGYNPFANLPPMSGPLGAVSQQLPAGSNVNTDGIGLGKYIKLDSTIADDFTPKTMGRPAPVTPDLSEQGYRSFLARAKFIGAPPTYEQWKSNIEQRISANAGGSGAMLPQQPTVQPTVQPTGQSMFPGATSMQGGFGQGAPGYPSLTMGSGGSGGFSGGSGGPFPLEGRYGIVKMNTGGALKNLPKGDAGVYRDTDPTTAKQDAFTAALTRMKAIQSRANIKGLPGIKAAAKPLGNVEEAAGGGMMSSIGGYSDGGRMLKGPGDGMSDSIPGIIGGKQPARLADGEFVVPADVVSHLGNGSTDAGARKLYKMMDKIRKARTGKKKQAPAVKADKYLPA